MTSNQTTAEILTPFGLRGTPSIDEGMIKLLEQVLSEAKAGEIAGFAMAVIKPNGVVGTLVRKGSASSCQCAGAVAVLQHDVLTAWRGKS